MQARDWMRARPLATACIGGVLLGLVVGLAMPIKASAPDPAELAGWTVYDQASLVRVDDATFAAAREARLLGREMNGAGAPGSPAAASWTLVGIIVDPAPTALVLAGAGKPPVGVRIGDTLPDGGKLLQIDARAVRFERAGCEFERALYSAGEVAVEDGCTLD